MVSIVVLAFVAVRCWWFGVGFGCGFVVVWWECCWVWLLCGLLNSVVHLC